jgi:hypothetical protein
VRKRFLSCSFSAPSPAVRSKAPRALRRSDIRCHRENLLPRPRRLGCPVLQLRLFISALLTIRRRIRTKSVQPVEAQTTCKRHPPCNPADCPHILISVVRSRLLVSSLKVSSKLFVLQPNVKKRSLYPRTVPCSRHSQFGFRRGLPDSENETSILFCNAVPRDGDGPGSLRPRYPASHRARA